MERLDHSLEKWMKEFHFEYLTEDMDIVFFGDLGSALRYLYNIPKRRLVHGDLQSDNVDVSGPRRPGHGLPNGQVI